MPWKVETVMSQREEFVTLAQSEGVNMSERCLRTGVSRRTGYKWLCHRRCKNDPVAPEWDCPTA